MLMTALGIQVPAWADWQSDWEQAKQAAAKEAEGVMYGPHLPYFKSVFELFQKSYPAIKLMFEPGRGVIISNGGRRNGAYVERKRGGLSGGRDQRVAIGRGIVRRDTNVLFAATCASRHQAVAR